MKLRFLDLGRQPIANNFLSSHKEVSDEYMYNLAVTFDTETKMVSLEEFVPPEMMFNDSYVYHSSMSSTMRSHFKEAADSLKAQFNPSSVLEIGSNDGVFLKNFDPSSASSVEPCGNFAQLTNELGYYTLPVFWDSDSADNILENRGPQDLVFSANCMCHIQDLKSAFDAVSNVLTETGVFVFEDPSLLKMIERRSYDQIYDEHAHIFSVTSLSNMLFKSGLEIFKVEELSVHGGSNRIYASPVGSRKIETSVEENLQKEKQSGLDEFITYQHFSSLVEQSKHQLVDILSELKRSGNKIVSYGATSKSTTIFNYCGITTDFIDYIVDTTPAKQGKLSPGVHIPVVSPEEGFDETVDYAFLGAWNFQKEIVGKEKGFMKKGRFITHVPHVRFV